MVGHRKGLLATVWFSMVLFALPVAVLAAASAASAAVVTRADPCASFAGQTFVKPAVALACLKSFPFNETLRQNVISVISRVFDFYTFEDFALNSPPPFQASTVNIRAEIARINSTKFEVRAFLLVLRSGTDR